MLWLLEAGLAAACFQIVAVALATAAVLLFMENDLVPEPLDFWSAAEISSKRRFISAQMDLLANSHRNGFDQQPVC